MPKIKIFPFPTGLHSIAMVRVEKALSSPIQSLSNPLSSRYQITCSPERADIHILHVIGLEAIEEGKRLISQGKRYIVIQYCGCSGDDLSIWYPLWSQSLFVWSYYDLSSYAENYPCFNFYHAPLGVDEIFTLPPPQEIQRRNRIMTSGHVSHSSQEPIQEVWLAAERLGIEIIHLGPREVQGITHYPKDIIFIGGISDSGLRDYYHSCKWVSALRHIEGFELPAIEGLSCGARPLCFDREEHQRWFGLNPTYIQEESGADLVECLFHALGHELGLWNMEEGDKVDQDEIDDIRQRFNWQTIIDGFYSELNHVLAHQRRPAITLGLLDDFEDRLNRKWPIVGDARIRGDINS